ncbi:phosphoglycolate phosphatase [Pseudoxanthomonas kalamensis DSM 18571]|uniref:phosphoglycolate phosphatase n=1 Tax=Pseudoxanthomonas kalamensis TaxID=289483 RepID=UPI0013917C9B|nr:phosphoglycolate phosphatase [Pseudoxanthomonas kalamensis]KAF1710407.1 phosphoglycolate phosphatase [Pseudoxanthomonas kalamensis DSM 18571]
MSPARFPPLVLFDLDGTLLDSAPDMLATVDRMRAARGVGPMALEALRPHVSRGARAMLGAAFPDVGVAIRERWVPEFLDIYRSEIGRNSQPFDGVAELLDALEADGSRWGIVTNKPEYLAHDILPALGWESRCRVLIGGDTLAEKKPHPLPLLEALRRLGATADQCVYVGDDERDIVAARAADMRSVVALWGYRLPEDVPDAWGGDRLIASPRDLLDPAAWPDQSAGAA